MEVPPRHISSPGDVTNNSEEAKIGIVRTSATETVSSEQVNVGSTNNSEQAKIGFVKASISKFDKSKTMDSMMEPVLELGRIIILEKILQLPENQIQKLVKEMEMAINANVTGIGSRIKVLNTEEVVNVVEILLYWDLLDELRTLGLIQQIEEKLTRYRNRILDKVLQLSKIQQRHLAIEMKTAIPQVLERIPANPNQPNLFGI